MPNVEATDLNGDLYSDESLARVVAESERLARLSPDDPEWLPVLGPQRYLPVEGYFDATANWPVGDALHFRRSSMVPWTTTVPPWTPGPGPISTM